MAMSLRVVVPPHPLIGHRLTMLRHRDTPPALYATGLQELGRWLTYEALRDWLPHRKERVPTTASETEGTAVEASVPLLAVPSLPCGLELWQGARSVLPDGTLPQWNPGGDRSQCRGDLVCGSSHRWQSCSQAAAATQGAGHRRKTGSSDYSSLRQPGVEIAWRGIPDLTLHTACIDETLNEDGQVEPGIGDPLRRPNLRAEAMTRFRTGSG